MSPIVCRLSTRAATRQETAQTDVQVTILQHGFGRCRYTPPLDSGRHRSRGPNPRPHRLARSGLQPFKLATRVRIPLGTPSRLWRDVVPSGIRSACLASGSERWVEYPLGTKPCLSARWRHQRDSVGAPRLRLGALGRIPVGDEALPVGAMAAPAGFGRRPSPTARSAGSNTRWGRSPACRRDGGTSGIRSAPLAYGSERWVEYPLGTKPCLSARWRHQRDSVGVPRLRLGALGRIPVGDEALPVGAEIEGVDLSHPLSQSQKDDIMRAWLEWQVLVFRNQELTREQHKDFGRSFGPLHVHPAAPELRVQRRARPGDPRRQDHPEVEVHGGRRLAHRRVVRREAADGVDALHQGDSRVRLERRHTFCRHVPCLRDSLGADAAVSRESGSGT